MNRLTTLLRTFKPRLLHVSNVFNTNTPISPSPSLPPHTRILLQTLVLTFLYAHLYTSYVGTIRLTEGPSMLPTLNVHGDWIYINKLYRRGRNIVVGDVVAIKHPMFPGVRASKRVLGMPGDFVLREGGVGGRGNGSKGIGRLEMIQVPEGHCWLAGDNPPYSRDSRDYGPLPLALVRGKVVAKVWPPSEMKWIENGLQPT